MNQKVYIIILNYNGWQDTIECLESILKSNYNNYQIIVVDNNSPNNSMNYIMRWANGEQDIIYDEGSQLQHLSQPVAAKPLDYIYYIQEQALTEEYLAKETSFENQLIFIQSGGNGGFAAGNNLGIKYALSKNDFEYIWLLNNDTVLEENSLNTLIACAGESNIDICGSVLKYYQAPSKVQAYGGSINKFFGTVKHILNKNELLTNLDYVVGAAFLINKNVINLIGLLPEEYFLYYEETDYCFNACKHDLKLGIALQSVVYHKEGNSTGANKNAASKSEFCDILSLKNRIKFHQKYLGGGLGLWLGMIISFAIRIKRGQINRVFKFFK